MGLVLLTASAIVTLSQLPAKVICASLILLIEINEQSTACHASNQNHAACWPASPIHPCDAASRSTSLGTPHPWEMSAPTPKPSSRVQTPDHIPCPPPPCRCVVSASEPSSQLRRDYSAFRSGSTASFCRPQCRLHCDRPLARPSQYLNLVGPHLHPPLTSRTSWSLTKDLIHHPQSHLSRRRQLRPARSEFPSLIHPARHVPKRHFVFWTSPVPTQRPTLHCGGR